MKKYLIFQMSLILALGCVIKGQTPHFDFISQASTNAIMDRNCIDLIKWIWNQYFGSRLV